MSHFLWVEDFDGKEEKKDFLGVTNNVFPWVEIGVSVNSLIELKKDLECHGIYLEVSFQDGISFIRKNLHKVDYIVLDIDLPAKTENDEIDDNTTAILQDYYCKAGELESDQNYITALHKLKKVAGFHIYTKLILEYSFPKNHIQFCSNHGEEMSSIMGSFRSAKMDCPQIYTKRDSSIGEWTEKRDSHPYSVLRRGVIEGCRELKNSIADADNTLSENIFPLNSFITDKYKKKTKEEITNYLSVLERFFPLREPENKEKESAIKLFCRELASNWDVKFNFKNFVRIDTNSEERQALFAFSNIMKMVRNWSSHSNIFAKLTEKDVAYLFIANMRAMFMDRRLSRQYEKDLLELFDDPIPKQKMNKIIGKRNGKISASYREIPLAKTYRSLSKEIGNKVPGLNFHEILKNIQKYNSSTNRIQLLIPGLYQSFWFLTSRGYIDTGREQSQEESNYLFYTFECYDYEKNNYIFMLARYIYRSSFNPN